MKRQKKNSHKRTEHTVLQYSIIDATLASCYSDKLIVFIGIYQQKCLRSNDPYFVK